MKNEVETIEETPTWEGLLPLFLAAAENGSKPALAELQRMARLADRCAAITKLTKDNLKDVSIKVTDDLVSAKLIPDCLDTDDEAEFAVQDCVCATLERHFFPKSKGGAL